MSHVSRRRMIGGLAGSAALALPASAAPESSTAITACVTLNGAWRFRLDPEKNGEAGKWFSTESEGWREVTVPHTWQVEQANTEYRGVAWYRRTFDVPTAWTGSALRLEFEAVFHSARVWVNGQFAGEHLRKGYTAFTLDIAGLVRFGAANTVAVSVDSAFDDAMLPRGRSSDWAHDGGIYRPVSLLVTPPVFVERVEIEAVPNLASKAAVRARVIVRNAGAQAASGALDLRIVDEHTGNTVVDQTAAARYNAGSGSAATVDVAAEVRNPRLWHFDHPHLYRLELKLASGHTVSETFGIRKIEIRGTRFYLNGEPIRPMGVERMAGSHPLYGMAEPATWIDHDHDDMKALNCVYTRVHWPQDRRVLDYCDRHGIMIQTEVPTWGGKTFEGMTTEPSAVIMNNGLEQLREMVARDRNHPCIFSWGMCNEIGGQNPPAYAFAKRMYEESKRLDPARLVTYASHSLFKTPEKDVSGLMDYVMCNQYYGSWQKGGPADLERMLDALHAAFPTKPIVISEYGYCACTADRPEGDALRISVLREQDKVFRDRDWIAGLIFFCYNDYRTHIGDKGRGVLRQRVHGVVDVYGARKPSYPVLVAESSPVENLEVSGSPATLIVRVAARRTVPGYTMRGYKVRGVLFGPADIPYEQAEVLLDDLAPGASATVTLKFAETAPGRVRVEVVRPTGFTVASKEA
jgi:beta-galactosidase